MNEIRTLNRDKSIKELRQMQDRDEVTGGYQRNPTALRHILAPTDLTLDAQKAVDYAANFARGSGVLEFTYLGTAASQWVRWTSQSTARGQSSF